MNAHLQPVTDTVSIPPENADFWRHVHDLLDSPAFAKAPRMRRLLTFLLEKKLAGKDSEINEYAIGLDVFDRDARHYDTMLDPSVRVQIGRLRSRLAAYYASLDDPAEVVITIPLGSYIPAVACARKDRTQSLTNMIQLAPLRSLTVAEGSNAFVWGLDEELGSRLFRCVDGGIRIGACEAWRPGDGGAAGYSFRLEGSVRVEDNHIRASLRLVDTGAGGIVWLSQFDRHGQLCMSLQEELATAICDELQGYLACHP